ncbi:MAG: hypothetical protein QOF09_2064 [Alphaproteobacteria bacterium]|jgi:hypothetical protein|nr:hypothetical protein [Alphaproteobacteria bacterium]
MPGWDSLQTVAAVHGAFQLMGLVLLVILAALAAFAAYQFRGGQWPEWFDVGDYQLRSRFFEIGCIAVFALLAVSEVMAYSYGLRQSSLVAAAEQASAERIGRLSRARAVADTPGRYLKENSELRQKLIDAENKLAALERTQTQKHLSLEQKRFLIEALRPFAGQKVSIASIRGDDEGLILAQEFVSVFEAAGWDHHGEAGVSTQEWPRDPVGIEVVLNEDDARADQIPPGVAGLINVVRQLGLVYDNTVYMDNDVPNGQALLKVGKKLRK